MNILRILIGFNVVEQQQVVFLFGQQQVVFFSSVEKAVI